MGGYGTFVEIGADITQICCMFEGMAFKKSIKRFDFGGSDITSHLSRLLYERGYYFKSNSELKIVDQIKEKICYVPLDYEKESEQFQKSSSLNQNYILPDGEVITLGNELIRSTECFFDQKLIGNESGSIQEWIFNSIFSSDMDSIKDLCTINLSGGSTLCKGFTERLEKELIGLFPTNFKVRLRSAIDRKYKVWVGGSIFTEYTRLPYWITKKEFEENGFSYQQRFNYFF